MSLVLVAGRVCAPGPASPGEAHGGMRGTWHGTLCPGDRQVCGSLAAACSWHEECCPMSLVLVAGRVCAAGLLTGQSGGGPRRHAGHCALYVHCRAHVGYSVKGSNVGCTIPTLPLPGYCASWQVHRVEEVEPLSDAHRCGSGVASHTSCTAVNGSLLIIVCVPVPCRPARGLLASVAVSCSLHMILLLSVFLSVWVWRCQPQSWGASCTAVNVSCASPRHSTILRRRPMPRRRMVRDCCRLFSVARSTCYSLPTLIEEAETVLTRDDLQPSHRRPFVC